MRKIAIRADASYEIGTGHVMRCLALAEGLRNSGWTPIFLSRDLPGNIFPKISDCGFQLVELAKPTGIPAGREGSSSPYANWLGVSWEQDADECKAAAGAAIDAYCVDHYALDRRWEERIADGSSPVIVIDDLAGRPHSCDLLLDANLGREASDYGPFVADGTTLLIGPRHALLRSEFAKWRQHSIERRSSGQLNSIVVAMGGVDQPNITGRIVSAIADTGLPQQFKLTVILGQSSPWVEHIQTQLSNLDFDAELRVNVDDMAATMARHDLAIGGAGVTAWERCCLGLPSLLVVMAENQRSGAGALADEGAALLLGCGEDFEGNVAAALARLKTDDNLGAMSKAAAAITDGRGVDRTVERIASLYE